MPSENDGIMVILSSPSGAGKTTLVKLLSEKENFEISVSHTTRQPRPNEVPNKDYFFVNHEEFKTVKDQNVRRCFKQSKENSCRSLRNR